MGWKAGLALIIGLGVLLTYTGVLPINNLFPEPRYGVPYSNLGVRNITAETYAKLRQEAPKITKASSSAVSGRTTLRSISDSGTCLSITVQTETGSPKHSISTR